MRLIHGILFVVLGGVGSVADVQTSGILTTLDSIEFSNFLEVADWAEPFTCWCGDQTLHQDDSCPVILPLIPQILKNGCDLHPHCCLHRTTSIELDTLQKHVTTDMELQSLLEKLNQIFNPKRTSNEVLEGRKMSSNNSPVHNNDLLQATSNVLDVKDYGFTKLASSNIDKFDVNKFDVRNEVKNFIQQWFTNSFIKNAANKTADDKLDNDSVRIVTYEELGPVFKGLELVLDIVVQMGIFVVLGSLLGILMSGYGGFAFDSCLICTIMDVIYQLQLF